MSSPEPSRLRPSQMSKTNANGSSPAASTTPSAGTPAQKVHPTPSLPTPTETLVLAAYPFLLLFGSVFSLLSPETRSAPYDPVAQAHVQDPSVVPGYFARKDNLVNTLFVKRGWAWMTLAFVVFVLGSSAAGARWWTARRRKQAFMRFGMITMGWVFVTQWFFGPAIIDRGFRFTGGKCDRVAAEIVEEGGPQNMAEVWSAVACKAVGGKWNGGHDISGHVFLLVLGSGMLLQEVGWVLWRASGSRAEERSAVMADGAIKRATVTASDQVEGSSGRFDLGVKFVGVVIALSWWMILMTAIYFHTWFEKVTGLLTALSCLYSVYIIPRWVPALRRIVGMPGI